MIKFYQLAILLSVAILVQSYQQVQLKKDQYGFTVGDKQGDLHLQFFIDFLCDDTKNSYQALIKVMNQVDFYKHGIKLTYQFSPLSWHFNSYKINQGIFYIDKKAFFFVWQKMGAQQAQKFIAFVLSSQDEFSQQKWADKKVSQFLDFFVQKISGVIKVDKKQLRSELTLGESWNTARHHWKYSVGTHGVSSTPTFNLNSVRIDGAENFTSENWIQFLNQFKKIKSIAPNLSVDNFYRQLTNHKGNK